MMKQERRRMEYRELELSTSILPVEEIYQAMGYRGQLPDVFVRQLTSDVLQEAFAWCTPRYLYQVVEARLVERHCLQVEGITFSIGKTIASYLPGVTHVCLFVTTAGQEYQDYLHQLKGQGDIVKEYVADAIGSVIAEACVAEISNELSACSEWKHSFPYSPGYCGWNISEQQKLFSLFPPIPCGITLSDSCLMSPIKSISGMIGLGGELQPQPYRCEICMNKHCYRRKEK